MIKRYEKCWGLSFPAIGRWKLELWLCMPNYKIREHSHDNQDIKLMFLFGKYVRFHRTKVDELLGEAYLATFPRDLFKIFNIRAGDRHWFEVSNWPLIFLNIEHWKPGATITSAAVDLHLTNNTYATTTSR